MNTKPLFRLSRIFVPLAMLLLLWACPPPVGDDDDSATPPDTGPAPVIVDVSVCEVPSLANCDAPRFGVRFAITATDADDNMNNPWWALLIDGLNPMDGYLEANLASGSTFNLNICGDWTRSSELEFRLWIQDEESNDSNDWEDVWTVPAQPGDDDCAPGSR